MTDREKVIKGIRKCLSHKPCSENGCPYENECAVEHLNDPLLRDAIELLKEQEDLGTELTNAVELIHKKNERIEKLLKNQEAQKFFVDESGKITPLPVVVRCKDCIYGKHEKNESTGMEWIYCAHHRESRPNEWFCASGSPTIKQEGR